MLLYISVSVVLHKNILFFLQRVHERGEAGTGGRLLLPAVQQEAGGSEAAGRLVCPRRARHPSQTLPPVRPPQCGHHQAGDPCRLPHRGLRYEP